MSDSYQYKKIDYSNEVVIGILDGEKIYRKYVAAVVNIPETTSFTSYTFAHNINNLKEVIESNVMIDRYTLPYINANGTIITSLYSINNEVIAIQNKGNWKGAYKLKAVL